MADDRVRTGSDETVIFEDGEVEGEVSTEGCEADAAEVSEDENENEGDEVEW